MAIGAKTFWRVRKNGLETNGGCFDPTVSGAGTDYTEQDTPQLSLTDLASATPYTTITSATGGFTSAMIGNGINIASGTGFTAGSYIITAVTDTNAAVVDRACATGAASGGVVKVGGAMALPFGVAHARRVSGNVIYIRGSGNNDPIDIDYPASTSYISGGFIHAFIGYNGRPKINHTGNIWSGTPSSLSVENIYFVQTSSGSLNAGIATAGVAYSEGYFYNCVFDQGGYDSVMMTNLSVINCSFINTGSSAVGTRAAYVQGDIYAQKGKSVIKNCLFKGLKFTAISVAAGQVNITGNVIQNCGGDGIAFPTNGNPSTFAECSNNTIYAVSGHGISIITTAFNLIHRNIISGITGIGKYGIFSTTTGAVFGVDISSNLKLSSNVFYGNTNNSNIPLLPSSNVTLDPQFADAPVDLTPTNTALRSINGLGSL